MEAAIRELMGAGTPPRFKFKDTYASIEFPVGYTVPAQATLEAKYNELLALEEDIQKTAIEGDLEVGTSNLFVDTETSNVGIGTTSPSSKLHVFGGALSADTDLATFHYTNGNQSYLKIRQVNHTPANANWTGWSTRIQHVTDVTDQSYIEFNPVGGTYATAFGMGGNEYMRIKNGGNVGIGRNSPAYKLDVNGSIRFNTSLLSTSSTQRLWTSGSSTNWIQFQTGGTSTNHILDIQANNGNCVVSSRSTTPLLLNPSSGGNVGIGTMSPGYKLHVNGDIYATGNITAYSDKRAKSDIQKIENALDKLEQLNGYTFTMNDKRYTGVIAQEVLPVLPEAVTGSEETNYAVAYGNMMGLIIEAIKELKKKIEQ
jgi:hypothetical protein